MLEKTLESPLDCKEIQPFQSKGDQSWVFIGGTDAEAEAPILQPPHAKSWLIGKDSDAGREWGQEKGTTEDEMAGWHHWLDGHGFEWTPGVGDRQGGLVGCNSWGHKESDMTEWLNWTRLNWNWYNNYGEQCIGSLKTKNRTTIWPCNPTPGHNPEKNMVQNYTYHNLCTPMFIAALFTTAKILKHPK